MMPRAAQFTPTRISRLREHVFSDAPSLIAGPARLVLIVFAYTTLLALSIPDNYVRDLRGDWAEAVVALLLLLDLPAFGRRNLRQVAGRLVFVAVAFGATVLVAEALRRLAPAPDATARFVWEMMREFHGERLYPAILWLFSPFAFEWRHGFAAGDERQGRWRMAIAGLLLAVAAWAFIASYVSRMPLRSFREFGDDLGIYAVLMLFWIRHASTWPQLSRTFRIAVLAVLILSTLASAVAGWTFAFAGNDLRKRMAEAEYNDARIITADWSRVRGYSPWRLSFPLGHHNRVAFLSMVCVVAFGMGAAVTLRRSAKLLLGGFAIVAMANLLMTLNRGTLVALGPAIFVATWSLAGRRAFLLLLLVPIGFFAMPKPQQKRALSIFKAETYRQDPTVVQRIGLFKGASLMALDFPVFGVGYGCDHMERMMRDEYGAKAGLPSLPPPKLHAHNIWLQIAAETGFVGLACWILFTAARWALLLAAWRRGPLLSRQQRLLVVTWIAVEVTIQVYSLSNYTLRRSLGLLTWILWAVMAADCLAILCRAPSAGESPPEKV